MLSACERSRESVLLSTVAVLSFASTSSIVRGGMARDLPEKWEVACLACSRETDWLGFAQAAPKSKIEKRARAKLGLNTGIRRMRIRASLLGGFGVFYRAVETPA